MTYEQEREAEYKSEQKRRRDRNLELAQRGRNWSAALEIWRSFVTAYRERCLARLEMHDYDNELELQDIVSTLRVLATLGVEGASYIAEGARAEKQLLEGE